MGDYDDADPGEPRTPRRRGWAVLLGVVAALAVGVGAGYLWGSSTVPTAPVQQPPPVAAPPTTAPPVVVPSPCVAVAQRGTDVLAQLDAAAQAVGALDPAALRRVLDEVRRLRDEMQREISACREQAGQVVPSGAGPGG